eukprot:COSAG03_NODE_2680_length_2529_cov_2.400412_2_plen_137_part_00
MEAGPAWHPRTAVSRRQRLGLDPRRGDAARSATGRRTATAARDHPTARAKSADSSSRWPPAAAQLQVLAFQQQPFFQYCREFKLSENVQAAGAWREHMYECIGILRHMRPHARSLSRSIDVSRSGRPRRGARRLIT